MKSKTMVGLLLVVALGAVVPVAAQSAAARAKQDRAIAAAASRLEKEPGYENSKAFKSLPSEVRFKALQRVFNKDLAELEAFIAAAQRKAARKAKEQHENRK